ncbi:hypothetical protein C8Q75DRAFT_742209 [Abortiporus biennis]|nr:hypothetical protein C8Q75DRAFT_742209 [Abortiporus biennis]
MSKFTTPFKFAPIPVVVLSVLVYLLVFGFVLVKDQTQGIPKNLRGLDLDRAYDDLHRITARPHPYNSHANEHVHQYLLSRLQSIESKYKHVRVSEDLKSNASFVSGTSAAYFEGTNILVRIDGTSETSTLKPDGVLLSAHYDSVSVAPGATDDGMGTVTLLQLVEYFARPENRPKRTAVFLFNNGEEDGLHGSHLFFEHPWSKLTTTFVNVEGAGAGGRPMLFRGTSLNPIRAFGVNGIAHPHGNALSQDAFSRGVVKSRTDYEVFEKGITGENNGMGGVDIAFYKHRAFYHTPLDSIPGMGKGEAKRSLWAMMESVHAGGSSLLNDGFADDGGSPGVFFDVLYETMLIFPIRYLLVTNIIVLVIGPIAVLILLGWVVFLSTRHIGSTHPSHTDTWARVKTVLSTLLGWGRFWLALLIGIAAQIGVVVGYVKLNPFIIHSHPYVVLTVSLATAYLGLVLPLAVFNSIFPSPQSTQKLAILLELFFLTWIFLVLETVAVSKLLAGGLYWITAWYMSVWVGTLIALGEAAYRAKKGGEGGKGELGLVGEQERERLLGEEDVEEHQYIRGVLYQAPESSEYPNSDNRPSETVEPIETEPVEITPLLKQHRHQSQGGRQYIVGVDNELLPVHDGKRGIIDEESGWWILQYLAIVPLPALLIFQIQIMLLHALSNTLVDGSSPIVPYGGIGLLSVLILINITPFAHKVHRGLTVFILGIFAIALLYSWTTFPFSQQAPLKIFFHSTVELDLPPFSSSRNRNAEGLNPSSGLVDVSEDNKEGQILKAYTVLTGPEDYLNRYLIPELPSSWNKNVTCTKDGQRAGLSTCKWQSDLLPFPGGNKSADLAPPSLMSSSRAVRTVDWLDVQWTRLNESSALISLKGVNTRVCTIAFDKPITWYRILDSESGNSLGRIQPGYEITNEGVKSLELNSRNWDNRFFVEFGWFGDEHSTMEGRVGCQYSEYATATAGSSHAAISAQIPALEEILHFFPFWAIPTKLIVGLLEAGGRFSV